MDKHFWAQQPPSITVKLSEFWLFPAMKTLWVCLRCLWSRVTFPEFREPAFRAIEPKIGMKNIEKCCFFACRPFFQQLFRKGLGFHSFHHHATCVFFCELEKLANYLACCRSRSHGNRLHRRFLVRTARGSVLNQLGSWFFHVFFGPGVFGVNRTPSSRDKNSYIG